MKVVILGAGAMGTLYGTTLQKAGHDVIYLEQWQPLIYALSKDPNAVLKTEDDIEKVPVKVYSISDAPDFEADLILVLVKSAATKSVFQQISKKKIITNNTVVITCQGGFENPEIIAEYLQNPKLLLVGCTKSHCKSAGPMTIEKYSIGKTNLWPHKLQISEKVPERVEKVINEANIQVTLDPTAITDRWKMLLTYPTIHAVSAVCGLVYGDVYDTEEGKALLEGIAKEVALIAKLDGIDQTLFNEEIAINHIADTVRANPDLPGVMLQDLKAHRASEADATSGALLRKATNIGVELPYTKSVWAIMRIKEQNFGSEY